jgi:hypothetical protein
MTFNRLEIGLERSDHQAADRRHGLRGLDS